MGIYLAPEELFCLCFKTKIGRYFETAQLIVSVSGCRSRNIVCIGAWIKVFVCLSENEHKAVLVMTNPLAPTANNGTHTQTHFPRGPCRVVRPMVIHLRQRLNLSQLRQSVMHNFRPARSSNSLIQRFKLTQKYHVIQNQRVQGFGVLYKEIGTLSLNKDEPLQ